MIAPAKLQVTESAYEVDGIYYICENCGWLYMHVSENVAGICPRCYRSELTTISGENQLNMYYRSNYR